MGEYAHRLGLMVDCRVQSGLIVEANKQFKAEARHRFVPLFLERAVLDRILHDFFPNKHWVGLNNDLAWKYQFPVIKRAIYRSFQLSGDTILNFAGIVDANDYRLNPRLQMLSNGMSNIP